MRFPTHSELPLAEISARGDGTVLLVRHGQTDHNRARRFNGRGDTVLNAHGREQAAALASFLQNLPLAAAWSSPLLRAQQTAAAVTGPRGLSVGLDARLAELDQGDLEGQPTADAIRQHAAFFAQWQADPGAARVPGGETMAEAQARMLSALADIAAQAPRGGPPVLVVSHNMAIAAALCGLEGAPLRRYQSYGQKNAAVTVLSADGARLRIVARDICNHLPGGP